MPIDRKRLLLQLQGGSRVKEDGVLGVFDLGFFSGDIPTRLPLELGQGSTRHTRRILWEVAGWLLIACGIFVRQALLLPSAQWLTPNLNLGAFLAAAMISLAVFPFFMRRLNRRRPKPGVEHVAIPFAFGFFLDLAATSALKIAPSIDWPW